ncbi:sensor domain-containing protein [Streptomyces sp. WAC05950]|uniref:sensor histidine kinase n=1 Tax=Streptomyces sp. WAC05950 TaxID=2487419 RepID=UPI0011E4CCFC|nr:sensor domain-containing protein [Streptomyces sp. WAC05950]
MTTSHAIPDNDRPPPVRPVFSAVTWKEIAHLVINLPEGIIGFVYAVVMVSTAGGLSVTAIGLPLLAVGLFLSRQWGRLERARARGLLGVRVEEPTPIPGPRRSGGFFPWLWASIKDPVGWRTVLYMLIRLPWGVLTFTVVLTGLFVLWPVLPYLVRLLANADRAMVRGLLSPSDGLERRIAELESDRGVVVDTAAADLRRIERDLHDGAQARLVSLGMTLDEATRLLDHDPTAARALLHEVRATAQRALQDLRELVHGVLPPVLADRGLGDAVRSLALDSHLDVHVEAALPGRLPAPVESAGYFAVAELLANAAKHSGAPEVRIRLSHTDGLLRVTVADGGRGGADPDGSGLRGLRRRLEPFDGTLVLHSPRGGPTTATLEIPCASSLPKTSSSSGTG